MVQERSDYEQKGKNKCGKYVSFSAAGSETGAGGDYPLTVIEAPMGYGKTTGMRFFLKKRELPYVWISASDSSQDYFWQQFCRAFSQIDSDVSCELDAMGFPGDKVLINMVIQLIGTVTVRQPVLFVIDDYHLVGSVKMNRFFEFLARENASRNSFCPDGEKPV